MFVVPSMGNEHRLKRTLLEDMGLGLLGIMASTLATLATLCGLVTLALLVLLTRV